MSLGVRSLARADTAVLAAVFVHGAFTLIALRVANASGPYVGVMIGISLGIGMCWASNTVSHIHLHHPLFRSPTANQFLSLYLSSVLMVPQRWWKLRHLAHHGISDANVVPRPRWLPDIKSAAEVAWVVLILATLATASPTLFVTVLLPALFVGYGLCAIQGYEEHARSASGVDHHGHLYNRLWFNDGYHAAHHRRPGAHWTELVKDVRVDDVTSAWPPILRLFESVPTVWNRTVCLLLDNLERVTMHLRAARRFQLRRHTRAFSALLAPVDHLLIRRVTVVGGGLFPRTVLVLAPLLPAAHFTVVDRQSTHLNRARLFLTEAGILDRVTCESGTYTPDRATACDLLVLPLAFRGDKACFYAKPPAPLIATHDWLWRRRGQASSIVSVFLVKRINLQWIRGERPFDG